MKDERYVNFFKSEGFIKSQHWIHSALAAASMAYFLALFSAGDNVDGSFLLNLSSWAFSMSLALNASIASLIVIADYDGEFVHELMTHRLFKWVGALSYQSFGAGVIFLLMYFSVISAFIFLLSLFFVYYLFMRSMNDISRKSELDARATQTEIIRLRAELVAEKNKKSKPQ